MRHGLSGKKPVVYWNDQWSYQKHVQSSTFFSSNTTLDPEFDATGHLTDPLFQKWQRFDNTYCL